MEEKLGRYIIQEQLGEGSFAYVYRAFDTELERHIALKILKSAWLSDPAAIARFKQEAKIMAKLHHPHIAVIYDVGEVEGQVYLAQFLVEGETLATRLTRGPLTWLEVLDILRSIASALDYAHGQGIVHRDIKPTNILLSKDGQAYLSDFGLVRAAEGSVSLSASIEGVKGTASYIPPEIWEGEKATPTSDVYALSCIVFEMLTGKVLFEGSSMMTVMRKHDRGPQFPKKWPRGVPEGVTEVLQHGLAAQPTERISRAGKLLTALEALRVSPRSSVPLKKDESVPVSVRLRNSIMPLLRVGVLLVAIVAIIVVGWVYLLSTKTETLPAGSKLAFASNRDGNSEIYVLNSDGAVNRMTNNPASNVEPVWSPDGSKLAFASNRDGNWEIYILDLDGVTKRMTNDPGMDREPAWSPDGSKLAFASNRDGNWEIYILDSDGVTKRMTNNPGMDREPAWSSDGSKLAFASDRDGNWEIYILDSDGVTKRMTNNPGMDREPAWSPDGAKLAFASDRDGNWEIYKLDSDGVTKRITNDPGMDREPAWSSDGSKLAFASNRDGNWEIYLLDLDGTINRMTTNNQASDKEPAWSP